MKEEILINNKEIIFDDLYQDYSSKLYIVQFFHDNVLYNYHIDIDVKLESGVYVDHCRYLGETNHHSYIEAVPDIKLTKEKDIMIFNEGKEIKFNEDQIKLIERYLNDYLSDNLDYLINLGLI